MAKYKTIPSILNNINHSYFSTLNFHEKGYMADWIWKLGIENNIWDIELNILDKTFNQAPFNHKALLVPIDNLILMVKKSLADADIDVSYIKELIMKIKLRKTSNEPCLHITTILTGHDDREYQSNEFVTKAYELKSMQISKENFLLSFLRKIFGRSNK